MKKKVIASLLAVGLTFGLLTGCEKAPAEGDKSSASTAGTNDSSAGEAAKDFGKIDITALDGSLCGAPIYIAYE